MVGDPIADMITRIKNAASAGNDSVSVPFSKIKLEIANLLKDEGYLKSVESSNDKIASAKKIDMTLSYISGNGAYGQRKSRVNDVLRVSKLSRRVYVSVQDLKKGVGYSKAGKGIVVLSTTSGIVTSKTAIEKGLGGEVLFKIW